MSRYLPFILLFILFNTASYAPLFSQIDSLVFDDGLPPEKSFFTDRILKTSLSNGIDLISISDSSTPLITIQITIKDHLLSQGVGHEGVSLLFFNLLLHTSIQFSDPELVEYALADIGGILHKKRTKNGIKISLKTHSQYFRNALELLYDLVFQASYNAENLREEIRDIGLEIQSLEAKPEYNLEKEINQKIFGDDAVYLDMMGKFRYLREVKIENLNAYEINLLKPENILISVSGPLDSAFIFNHIDTILASLSDRSLLNIPPLKLTNKWQENPYLIQDNEMAKVPLFYFTWMGPSIEDDPEGSLAAQLFAELMNDETSNIHKSLVDQHLAHSTHFSFSPGKTFSTLQLSVIASPGLLKYCYEAAESSFVQWEKSNYLDWEKLPALINNLIIEERLSQDRSGDYLGRMDEGWSMGDWEMYPEWESRISQLDQSKVDAFVKKYLLNKASMNALLCTNSERRISEADSFFRIPPPPPPVIIIPELTAYQIRFDMNSTDPDSLSKISLSEIATHLKNFPERQVYLDGHTDQVGSKKYNQKLSEERAEEVKSYLLENFDSDPEQIQTRGFGESRLAFENESDEIMAQNRRVEVSWVELDQSEEEENELE